MIDGSLKPVSTTIGASPPVMRKPKRRDLLRLSGVVGQHEEARVELDVAQVEDVHFETHSLLLGGWMTFRRRLSAAPAPARHRTFG